MKRKRIVKPEPYESEVSVCDICGVEDGERAVEFYTPYDLGDIASEYPYERHLDLCEPCKAVFVERYAPRIWRVMDEVIDEIKNARSGDDSKE